jgi:secreted trypsin-like serine protease
MGVRFSFFVCLFCASAPALAGTIRHDRDPQAYLDFAQAPQFASAGRMSVTRGAPGISSSGVLVSDRWVLTAAHVVLGAVDAKFIVGGNEYAVDGWVVHQKYDGSVRAGSDLALVRLSQPVTGITPAILNRSKREQGQQASIVGFGLTGNGIDGVQVYSEADFLKRAGTNVIDGTIDVRGGFGQYKPKLGGSKIFIYDFDNPDNAADNTLGSPTPTDLEFLIAQGDSGGPTFIDFGRGDGPVLAGIHSFGEFRDLADDSDYGDFGADTRVASYRSWITKTMKRGDLGRPIKGFVTPGSSASVDVSGSALPEPSVTVILLAAGTLLGRRRVNVSSK